MSQGRRACLKSIHGNSKGSAMLTDQQILNLIGCPKIITKKEPARGYREYNRHRRCDLELEFVDDSEAAFTVFIRQNNEFIENFSIGLRFQTNSPTLGAITLIRYNGPHGETSRDPDGHYARSHIHRITASELESGSVQPQETNREVTDRYSTFEQGLTVFFTDIRVTNFEDYYPGLLQGNLFDGHS